MSVKWTIVGENTSGTFADLQLANLKRSLVSQGADVVKFDAPGTAFDAAAMFQYRELVTIKRDGENWFKGIVRTVPRMGAPADERIAYELAGPWWYLEHIVYQQNWMMWDEDKAGGAGLDLLQKSRVIINQDEDGNAITSGAQIIDALQHAIDKGAPISIGAIAPTLQLPFDEQVDLSVAEVIIRILKFLPDYSVYFDYSKANPQLNIVSRTAAAAKTYKVSAGWPAHGLQVTAREDLKIPGIVCRFEQTHSVDGDSYESTVVQEAGDTSDYETLVATISLGGSSMSFLKQKIEVEEIPDPMEDLTWIQGHDAWFKIFTNPAHVQIVSVTRNGALDLPNILIEAQIHEWMDVETETEEFTVEAICDIFDANGAFVLQEIVKRRFKVTSTDAISKTYRQLDSYESGEAIPEGMAAGLYQSWSQLQYDGNFTLMEEECTSDVRPGHVLNLTGGVGAWASMRALIQGVEEDVDQGITKITFGPARRIGVDDLVTLMRGFRTKTAPKSTTVRQTGLTDDRGNVAPLGGGPAAQNVVAGGPGEARKQTFRKDGETYSQLIQIDPDDVSKTDADITIKAREIHICVDGVEKAMQIMCSEPYDL